MPLGCATVALLLLRQTPALRTLRPDDYKSWEQITSRDISNDGRWLWYQIGLEDGDSYLVVKNNDDPRAARIPNAGKAEFSDDSKWCAYLISPPRAEAEKLQTEKKPVFTKLGLRNLDTGTETVFDSVLSFRFLKGSRCLMMHRFPAAPLPNAPADLLLVTLATGWVLPVSNVITAASNEDGSELAMAVRTNAEDQAVEVLDTKSLAIRPLQWGKEDPSSFTWSKDGHSFAFLLGKKDPAKEGDFNQVVDFTGLPDKPEAHILDPKGKPWLSDGKRVAESRPLELSDDGTEVAFGIGDWHPNPKTDDKAHPEVWNSGDLRPIPQQRVTAAADRNRTDLAVWQPASGDVQQITKGWQESATLLKGLKTAVLSTSEPYLRAANDGFGYRDVYLIDTSSGKRTPVLKKSHWTVEPSIDGKYLAYYKDRDWWVYDIAKGVSLDVTRPTRRTFEDPEDDHTTPEKPPADTPTWLARDEAVIFGDYYDSWLFRTSDSKLTRLTDGAKDHVTYRFLDPELDEDGPTLKKTLFFSSFDHDSKASGFFACDQRGKGKSLIADLARIGGLKKAKDADRVVFTMGSDQKSPNLYITNQVFSAMKPESKTNPQQAGFLWPKRELVEYKSRWGKPLQGVLMYPADYQKGRLYPMVTYIYERLSDGLFNYVGPQETNPYNQLILNENGYFVFMPDIAYKGNTPGQNAVDCLEPALSAVIAKHVGVDPDRIGLMGHSWGAYQTAFVSTVSSRFRAAVAGAPLTDLISMYNTYYWNTGSSNAPILETSQGRMRVPFWEDPKAYIENSPVWQSTKRKAPILIEVGDQDGAVDYHQGLALYSTLRRMGKECVLVLYNGENHGLSKREDQLDYGHRLRHFMDVYLKDAKPEPWISKGVPFIDRDQG